MGRMKELSAEIEQMDLMRAGLVEEALRDVINCWEQGGTLRNRRRYEQGCDCFGRGAEIQ
jgi:hypothetical protein